MSTPNAKYWHALNLILATNLWKVAKLSLKFGGPQTLLSSDSSHLLKDGMEPSIVTKIMTNRSNIDVDAEWEKLMKTGMNAICFDDLAYPPRLKQIDSAPPLLYIRGDASLLSEDSIAVVGSRKITSYGHQAVSALVPQLAQFGLPVVSGMAFGVDSAALTACIEYGGKPIAVLASSLSYPEISPQSNLRLAKLIEAEGCLVSENPPGRSAHKLFFPLRNRIIAGLSMGTVIIEGALKSGSLITARLALEQNREVFAVPGSIFSHNSAGTNDLIKRGAKCITSFSDIAAEFGWDLAPTQTTLNFDSKLHNQICQALRGTPADANSIVALTKIPAAEVLAALTELELKGVLRKSPDGVYAICK